MRAIKELLVLLALLGFVPVVSAQDSLNAQSRPPLRARFPQGLVVSAQDSLNAQRVDFERHIMGLFGKMGCAAGSCHGSFQGKGGFRLSLFGYDPEKDYHALTRESFGRRTNPANPNHSLLLLKTTGQVEHGGGVRFSKGSWQYRAFRDWITTGAVWQKGSGEVISMAVHPPELAFQKAGETVQLTVRAKCKDGSDEDVTSYCELRVNDDSVAEVAPDGSIKGLKPGDTSLVVAYRGNVIALRALVPLEHAATFQAAEANYVDTHVFAKLRRLNMAPSDLTGDAEFLRRVTLDTIGALPTRGDRNSRTDESKTPRVVLDLRAASGKFTVQWYRAKDGSVHDGGTVEGGEARDLTSPWKGADVVVRLVKKK